jgi:YggT family protein
VLQSILALIIDTAASVLGGVLLLRFWVQTVRVRAPTPISQFTFQLTDWLVRPLRRIIPGLGGYDWASLTAAFLVALLATALEASMQRYFVLVPVLVLALQQLLIWITYGLMALIVIEAVFSWVNPQAPLAPFVRALNDPLLSRLRRVVPPLGMIDLSPLVALVLLQIVLYLVRTLPNMLL